MEAPGELKSVELRGKTLKGGGRPLTKTCHILVSVFQITEIELMQLKGPLAGSVHVGHQSLRSRTSEGCLVCNKGQELFWNVNCG